jgi:hypothetical protein
MHFPARFAKSAQILRRFHPASFPLHPSFHSFYQPRFSHVSPMIPGFSRGLPTHLNSTSQLTLAARQASFPGLFH